MENCNDVRIKVLLKYFKMWHNFTTEEKYSKDMASKNKKMNSFLEMLIAHKKELRKNQQMNSRNSSYNSYSSDSSSLEKDQHRMNALNKTEIYYNRFQAQKNTIALQKTQIEKQKRFIEELKLKRIVEDASFGNEGVKEIRKSLIECDKTLKPKLKFMIGEDSTESVSDKVLELQCMKVPRFLQRMEQRAREREEKRAIVRERRRQMETERERMKEQMLIARQLLDQDERNKKLDEFKEKRKQEQLTLIRNRQLRDKIRALTVMADLHYEKKLLSKYGIRVWILFVRKTEEDYRLSVRHYEFNLIKRHFIRWHVRTEDVICDRNERADSMHKLKLTRWVYREWKGDHTKMVNKRQEAEDWYDLHVTERLFYLWRLNTLQLKLMRKRQWETAVEHHNSRLKWRVIGYWQTLPTIMKLEREHEARKQRWRLKVQQVLPDYIPQEMD